jgi:hypothetical protein
MKAKLTIFVFFFLSAFLIFTQRVQAEAKSAGLSATFITTPISLKKDNRVDMLKKYLEKVDSPLAPYAQDFITQADEYSLPWYMVAAISGTESTFGNAVPANCNNAWGFGIYTNHMTCFASYPEAIKTISQALRENYIDKLQSSNLEDIGRIYAASPAWAGHTLYFVQNMENFQASYDNQSLSISL